MICVYTEYVRVFFNRLSCCWKSVACEHKSKRKLKKR